MATNYQFELTEVLLAITVNKTKSFSKKNDLQCIDNTPPYTEPEKTEKTIIDEMSEMNNNINQGHISKNDFFECVFVTQSYKTAKLFELSVKSIDLPKINNIFAIDPTIMLDIIREKPHSTSIIMSDDKEDHVVIEYIKEFFNRKISLIFKIPEKQYSEGSDAEVVDLKRMNRLLHQDISEMKKLNQQCQDTVQELKTEIINLREEIKTRVSESQKEITNLINDDKIKTEKTIIVVPFNNLMVSSEIAHDFLNDHYCSDEYKKLAASKANTTKQILVDEFLNTRLKKLLFNMHYINRINKRKFVSVYDHCTNQGTNRNKMSAVGDYGLGFITVHTEKKYRYAKFNEQAIFNNIFVFDWLRSTIPAVNENCDLFTRYANSTHPQNSQPFDFMFYLKIAQLKMN